MAAEVKKVGVEGYMTKHKVSALFEELMAQVIKQLPDDPIEFLIKKLQLLQQRQKKKVVTPHVASISPAKSRGSRIEVTGTSVASKTSKSPVSEQLGKSTSGLRPLKTKPIGLSSTSISSIKAPPTKTTPTRIARPATSSGISRGVTKSGSKLKPMSSSSSRSPGATKSAAISRPTTAPGAMKVGSGEGHRTSGLPTRTSRQGVSVSARGKKISQSPTNPRSLSKKEPEGGKNVKEMEAVTTIAGEKEESVVSKIEVSVDQIDEFFGDGKKSSQKAYYVEEEEEEEEESGGVESEEGEGVECVQSVLDNRSSNSLDIQDIRRRRDETANGRHRSNQRTRHKKLQSLLEEESVQATPLSLGYHDTTESSDSECGVEDVDALRDEGVEVTMATHGFVRKSVNASSVTSETVLCARCACALNEGGSSLPSSSVPPSLDFESASQVAGQVPFPQWGPEGSSSVELHTSGSDQDTSSEVTLQSHDTWGGLGPSQRPQLQLSDEESEVQLPSVLPLEGHSWAPATATHPSHGWGQQN